MFSINDKVVYPGHGVARINRLVEITISGVQTTCYELVFLHKDATILVPIKNADAVGIRPLSSNDNVKDVFNLLAIPARKLNSYEFTASSWNKRNKEYQRKLRQGGLKELSEIYRDLRYIETQKELSFGEKNLLQQTESLLVEEISLIQKSEQERTIEQLRALCHITRKKYSGTQEHAL